MIWTIMTRTTSELMAGEVQVLFSFQTDSATWHAGRGHAHTPLFISHRKVFCKHPIGRAQDFHPYSPTSSKVIQVVGLLPITLVRL